MSEFNNGDRVRYEGGHPIAADADQIGKLGTVKSTRISFRPDDKIVNVEWDDGRSFGVYADNLRNLTQQDTALDILTAFGVPNDIRTAFGFDPAEPEPTLQETLRTGAEEAEKQARALQAYASASVRLADSIDRLENLTK